MNANEQRHQQSCVAKPIHCAVIISKTWPLEEQLLNEFSRRWNYTPFPPLFHPTGRGEGLGTVKSHKSSRKAEISISLMMVIGGNSAGG